MEKAIYNQWKNETEQSSKRATRLVLTLLVLIYAGINTYAWFNIDPNLRYVAFFSTLVTFIIVGIALRMPDKHKEPVVSQQPVKESFENSPQIA